MNKENHISIKNPEIGSILDSLEKQIALARILEGVYDKRPNPEDFVGILKGTKFETLYTQEAVYDDLEYVKNRHQKIEELNKSKGEEVFTLLESGFSLSEMMQAMIVDMINKGLLPNFQAIMSSEFDDLKSGIDAVLKREEGKYLGASFDFTFSVNTTTIQDKLRSNWEYGVEKHQIPIVKYFEDPNTKEKKNLLVPKFIIGCSKKDIESFARLYLENKEHEIINHTFKFFMVKQIDMQLQAALKFLEQRLDDPRYAFTYQQYKKIDAFMKELKIEIGYSDFVNTKDFHEYKQSSSFYNALKDFYKDK